ncbi:site-specific DNA-methyltransferase [Acidithiobacillus ferriphilus]|uniref:site-specific DNA-methyltransferase n=1 Tax=Acidithiobacillus ferriphilus TaxID=1689834 RepID=UPI001E5920F3|nr:site-specific DNA-methyltransferase [Acidithiobacillus ferriphilus]UEP58353.1 site-specific DNA-methyltransferase [Acidithiobacillus ferriphilus]
MPFLDWVNKAQAVCSAADVPYHLLQFESAHGDPSAENLLIQGDNLKALKALLPFYRGQVNCIYADPPFNTEQAFPDYDDKLEHSQWLTMLYPALELQRELLAPDGTLFIHIDDNELGYLIAIADEVMNRKNRVAIVTFKQGAATGHKSINPGMVSTTNFILVYAKDKACWKPNRLFTGRERDKRYGSFLVNPDDHFSEWRLSTLSAAFAIAKGKKITELRKELGPLLLEDQLNDFVIEHAGQVIQPVRPDYDAVSEAAQKLIDQSLAEPEKIFLLERDGYSDMYFRGGQRWIFYREKLKEIDGVLVAGEPLTTLWDDLLSNNLHKEGGVEFPKSKKPEALLKRVIELSTKAGDLVLDGFLGSGTTAAVAHKMGRRYLGIERGEHAVTKCLPRLNAVIEGDPNGVSRSIGWQGGGGFRFHTLGEPVFDADGGIHPAVRFKALAAFLWHFETGEPVVQTFDKPLLGIHNGTAYTLLYNGILGDRRPQGGNVLTSAVLAHLEEQFPRTGPRVIYGETTRLGEARLREAGITFKQIPYDIKAR